jgi:hypothetical protein
MWYTNVADVRSRAEVALIATATISRKVGSAWTTVGVSRPCMVETASTNRPGADPVNASPDATVGWTVSFAWNENVKAGDRLTITGGDGAAEYPTMTVTRANDESVAVYRQVIATAEELASESYLVTIERWSDIGNAYTAVGTYTVRAVIGWSGTEAQIETGAEAATREGTMLAPANINAKTGDWIYGLPWGGAQVTAVMDQVGSQRDVKFVLNTAS